MLAVPVLAQAANEYTLKYKDTNHWVAQEDIQPLRNVIKDARSSRTRYFQVKLPSGDKNLQVERLKILQNILSRQLRSGVIIEQVPGEAGKNTILVTVAKRPY